MIRFINNTIKGSTFHQRNDNTSKMQILKGRKFGKSHCTFFKEIQQFLFKIYSFYQDDIDNK